jgi:predicted nucleic acid-binding protein
MEELSEERIRIYTSIITVQEMSVAVYRKGAKTKDTYGDIHALARIYSVTKEVALTAAHREAELKDLSETEAQKKSAKKPETEDEKLERICENRRRRWDCFHLATAQAIGCSVIYSTDDKLQKRPGQLGLKDLKVVPPKPTEPSIEGPLFPKVMGWSA